MLRINSSQMASFGERAWRQFVDGMLAHAQVHWPGTCESLGEERARGAVEATARAARDFGFETEYDVGRFIHLAFAFETMHFTSQEWALPVMSDPDLPPRVRMNQLFTAAVAHLDRHGA